MEERPRMRPRPINIHQGMPVVHITEQSKAIVLNRLPPDPLHASLSLDIQDYIRYWVLQEDKGNDSKTMEEETGEEMEVEKKKEDIPTPGVRQVAEVDGRTDWKLPPHYITYSETYDEPLQMSSDEQAVEYDADSEDEALVNSMNKRLRQQRRRTIKLQMLEQMIDAFEKRAFLLFNDKSEMDAILKLAEEEEKTKTRVRRRPVMPRVTSTSPDTNKKASGNILDMFDAQREHNRRVYAERTEQMELELAEDVGELCQICRIGDSTSEDVIVFCDGCNVAVHQHCYGIAEIPSGSWFCAKCSYLKEHGKAMPKDVDKVVHIVQDDDRDEPSCCLCEMKNGALKRTVEGKWAHVVCAMWMPETYFKDWKLMEPIAGIPNITPDRYHLNCVVCKRPKTGACIQCKDRNCYDSFHPICALNAGFLMEMHEGKGKGKNNVILRTYCKKHTKKIKDDRRRKQLLAPRTLADENSIFAKQTKQAALLRDKTIETYYRPWVIDDLYRHWLDKRKRLDPNYSKFLIRRLTVLAQDNQATQIFRERFKTKPNEKALALKQDSNTKASDGVVVDSVPVAPVDGSLVVPEKHGFLKLQDKTLTPSESWVAMLKIRQSLDITRILVDLCLKRETTKQKRIKILQDIFEQQLKEIEKEKTRKERGGTGQEDNKENQGFEYDDNIRPVKRNRVELSKVTGNAMDVVSSSCSDADPSQSISQLPLLVVKWGNLSNGGGYTVNKRHKKRKKSNNKLTLSSTKRNTNKRPLPEGLQPQYENDNPPGQSNKNKFQTNILNYFKPK
eukprot:CAMPEP_0174261300 /NCGR_PEP_ID=MMETSP0439-20130205/11350_1 /TAXON_ID=0 /ORGANISM="Stereomyxa ramosa, Strain Chinc5" /LENGTH=786 /DNA_ID=CAMNT_0015345755 /DNA_START=53 /DNA_END=2413 /DNA_ORIENTATION=+